MKQLLKLEFAAQLVAGVWLLWWVPLHLSWWIYLLLFFAPDLAILGYVFGPLAGARLYNLTHHKALALAVALSGMFLSSQVMLIIGIVLFTHIAFDRLLGYGLKYNDAFVHTHLGIIGKQNTVH